MNRPLNVDAPARAYYDAMVEDIKLRYPRLPMPDWDNAGDETQEVAREIAHARAHQSHDLATGSALVHVAPCTRPALPVAPAASDSSARCAAQSAVAAATSPKGV